VSPQTVDTRRGGHGGGGTANAFASTQKSQPWMILGA
ncbi:hypothetical protein PSYMO_37601, partial [Pseudomonas amygdali pv. mori str. 301020]